MIRYGAFISYSHADTPCARWLHHALETYRVPRKLVDSETTVGTVPRRLPPIFRDRDELPASGDLGTELRAALAAAAFQIVLCSERAAKSHWVNEEILAFKRLHGEHRTLALIVGGEPYSADHECFPAALRFKLGPDGALSDIPAEPIAADIRPGGDGKRLASLKIIAGLTGLPLDALVQRDAARRQRRLAYIAGGAVMVALTTVGLALYANQQRIVAEEQKRMADASLDFLIGTFSIANPATENPRTITAITILDRVSKRVQAGELKTRPEVRGRLLSATGDIYINLGLGKEAERDLLAALKLQPKRGGDRAAILLKLAGVAFKRDDSPRTKALVDEAEHSFDASDKQAPYLTARIVELRGLLSFLNSKFSFAGVLLKRAAALYLSVPGDHQRDVGRALMNAGNALTKAKMFMEADEAFARAEQLYVDSYGANHVLTATAIQNRAFGAFEAGHLAQAEQLANRALNLNRRLLDVDHPTIGAANVLLGRIRHARGDFAGATKAFDDAIGLFNKIYGGRNAELGDAALYGAQEAADSGDNVRAGDLLKITQTAYDATYGSMDIEQVYLLETRAQIAEVAGRKSDATRECASAIQLRVTIDRGDPELPAARAHCAALLAEPPRISLRFQPAGATAR